MRDAIGGTFTFQIIIFFLVLVSGYLAFSVNYSKAFRAKNKVIDVYEAYEGNLKNDRAQEKINTYFKQIGYNPAQEYVNVKNAECAEIGSSTGGSTTGSDASKVCGKCECQNGFCIKEVCDTENSSTLLSKKYAEVTTFVSIDIPIMKWVLSRIPFFTVKGSSSTVTTYK